MPITESEKEYNQPSPSTIDPKYSKGAPVARDMPDAKVSAEAKAMDELFARRAAEVQTVGGDKDKPVVGDATAKLAVRVGLVSLKGAGRE